MPDFFFDTSVLVKRYHREPGSGWVTTVCNDRARPNIFVSHMAFVEGFAALRRLGHINIYHHSYVDAMIQMFRRDFDRSDPSKSMPTYILIPISPNAPAEGFAGINPMFLAPP
jgi:hypothetical protein